MHSETWQLLKPCWQPSYVFNTDDCTIAKVYKLHQKTNSSQNKLLLNNRNSFSIQCQRETAEDRYTTAVNRTKSSNTYYKNLQKMLQKNDHTITAPKNHDQYLTGPCKTKSVNPDYVSVCVNKNSLCICAVTAEFMYIQNFYVYVCQYVMYNCILLPL